MIFGNLFRIINKEQKQKLMKEHLPSNFDD